MEGGRNLGIVKLAPTDDYVNVAKETVSWAH